MSDDTPVSPPKPPRPVPTEREARLAQALRANLRRRKSAAAAPEDTDGDAS